MSNSRPTVSFDLSQANLYLQNGGIVTLEGRGCLYDEVVQILVAQGYRKLVQQLQSIRIYEDSTYIGQAVWNQRLQGEARGTLHKPTCT